MTQENYCNVTLIQGYSIRFNHEYLAMQYYGPNTVGGGYICPIEPSNDLSKNLSKKIKELMEKFPDGTELVFDHLMTINNFQKIIHDLGKKDPTLDFRIKTNQFNSDKK